MFVLVVKNELLLLLEFYSSSVHIKKENAELFLRCRRIFSHIIVLWWCSDYTYSQLVLLKFLNNNKNRSKILVPPAAPIPSRQASLVNHLHFNKIIKLSYNRQLYIPLRQLSRRIPRNSIGACAFVFECIILLYFVICWDSLRHSSYLNYIATG